MNSRDFRMLFLYEWESKHNAAAAVWNVNAAFGNGSVKERTTRHWSAKSKTRDESLTNEDHGGTEIVVNTEVLRAIGGTNPGNIVRDCAEELLQSFCFI